MLRAIKPDWTGCAAIVAASGPGLTAETVREVAALGSDWRVLAVSDAYRLMPWAHALYATDGRWWRHNNGCQDFAGERWSSHNNETASDEKRDIAVEYGLSLVRGARNEGFSLDPSMIHYGDNSGFAGINLAILKGARYIVLVGFNMQSVNGKSHFFGAHPPAMEKNAYTDYLPRYREAAKLLPANIEITNCTPDSLLNCFPEALLTNAIGAYKRRQDRCLHRHRAVAHA